MHLGSMNYKLHIYIFEMIFKTAYEGTHVLTLRVVPLLRDCGTKDLYDTLKSSMK